MGLLHEEMRRAGSLVMRAADAHKLPAGGALAVDRHGFSAAVTDSLEDHPRIDDRPRGNHRIAARRLGPGDRGHRPADLRGSRRRDRARHRRGASGLFRRHRAHRPPRIRSISTSPGSSRATTRKARAAAWPITSTCRSTEPQYEAFVAALLAGEKTDFKEWEKSTPYFEACLPIEVMAARGLDTLRFGPMKPVGLKDPQQRMSGPMPWCNCARTTSWARLWNMVGFQTKLKHAEQVAHLPHHSGPGECASSRGWADCTATPSSILRACWTASCG